MRKRKKKKQTTKCQISYKKYLKLKNTVYQDLKFQVALTSKAVNNRKKVTAV